MKSKIALFNNERFKNGSEELRITVIVFEKNGALWNESDRYYVNIDREGGLDAPRRALAELLGRLGDCRIAAGAEISGVLYRELDARGFSIFEIGDYSPDMLDGILMDIEAAENEKAAPEAPASPVETETPGVYFLDLLRLQAERPEVSSKAALRAFLDSTPFLELRLVCAHVPPWLEGGPYDILTQMMNGAIEATIRKKRCAEGSSSFRR